MINRSLCLLLFAAPLCAQEPTGTIAGSVTDPSGATVPAAKVQVTALSSGLSETRATAPDGSFTFPALAAGNYTLSVTAPGFAPFTVEGLAVEIGRTVRVPAHLVIAGHERVSVEGILQQVDTDSNSLGRTVTGRQVLDLPLNGRNFTQLGLLQAGVVPLTNGLISGGGSIRASQAFAVNGQRPESNNYLLDGVTNVQRMDGGYAIKTPVDAIQEFRILTHTAPPEYGVNSGSTVSVVTRSGTNDPHGNVYYFGRNDVLDARNFFSQDVEPLKQHQYGATLGGPIRRNKLFAFGYWEGFRNRQGVTKTATVPTAQQRTGNFSDLVDPSTNNLLINFLTGQPFPGNQIPPFLLSPVSQKVLQYYPLGNTSPTTYTATQVQQNVNDQGGARLDWNQSESNLWSLRYAVSSGSNVNPLSIRGADLPGFPVGDDLATNSAAVSQTHLFSSSVLNNARVSFFRNSFLFDKRFNRDSPRSLGFNYDSTLAAAEGPPYFIINGYASAGDPITGPRQSVQNTWELSDALSIVHGAHTLKLGGEFRRTQINMSEGIAANGFFVFAPFPTNNAFANFLIGFPVVFFQAGGDFSRGLRTFDTAAYAQDQWRATRRLTVNYGVRYEINSPFAEIRDRFNEFAPGRQSTVRPEAPEGLLFPGDPGVAKRIVDVYYKGIMPRAGLAFDPAGSGRSSIRAAYGIFYDPLANGSGMPMQAAISAIPFLQAVQIGPPALDYTDPWRGQPPFRPNLYPAPSTLLVDDATARPPYAQDWNFSIERALPGGLLIEARYVGTKGTRLPRLIEANPSIYAPDSRSADQRRIYAGCRPDGSCDYSSVGQVSYSTNSTYHAGQLTLSREFRHGFAFQTSYWFSKTLDYVSSMEIAGSAPRLISGENDLAQNPFNLRAEHGPSLFDARHRWTFNGIWQIPHSRGWQLNAIANISSGTPFTIYDSSNVAQQGSTPEITGFAGTRPDLIGDPNAGPHTPDQWITPASFRRLDPVTQAGQFGNAGRNIARGPGQGNLDLSVFKTWKFAESRHLQLRLEAFNVTNHPNFGVPVNDLVSPNFGRILEAGPPRVFQAALKVWF